MRSPKTFLLINHIDRTPTRFTQFLILHLVKSSSEGKVCGRRNQNTCSFGTGWS